MAPDGARVARFTICAALGVILSVSHRGKQPKRSSAARRRAKGNYLVETEVLAKAQDVGTYYTNELIDEINKFDEAAIVKQAREFKL